MYIGLCAAITADIACNRTTCLSFIRNARNPPLFLSSSRCIRSTLSERVFRKMKKGRLLVAVCPHRTREVR